MDKLERVIQGLECCMSEKICSSKCPYKGQCDDGGYYYSKAIEDAISLLKAQEAIKPYIDYDGQDVWRCGKCGNSLMHPSYYESDEDAKNHIRYCSHCGKAVKWE